ncbi:hypothetical protein ACQ858_13625 [Variovorax ureilyticus]|uniref:hypothetical protein n=1 Tax=Variovorax ureilyticus TaxID=1836198 RepID=UPI003D674888
MSQFDMFLMEGSQIAREITQRRLQVDEEIRQAERDRQARATIQTLRDANAGNLALRCALLEQLRRVDPSNPFARDAALQERVLRLGQSALEITGDWDEVRKVGREFQVPRRDR